MLKGKSFVIVSKATSLAVMELYNKDIISKVNRDKYRVIPIYDYLTSLNA